MGVFYETTRPVGAAEAGLGMQCRPAGVVSLLQEAATEAFGQFHCAAPEMLEKYNALWMVSRIWYRLDRPLMWGDPLTIRTWHRADHGAMLYREFDLQVGGSPVGEALSIWILVDADSRRVLRMSDFPEIQASGGGALCRDKRLSALHIRRELPFVEKRRFHYSDLDLNDHVNHVRYVDLAADACALERELPRRFVSAMQIGYTKECMAGETIDLYAGSDGDQRLVYGVGKEGTERFAARLTLSDIPR